MKGPRSGSIAAAILILVATVGWGVAQAGGTGTTDRVYGFEDQEFIQGINAPEPDLDHQPMLAEGMSGYETTVQGPVETGSMPSESHEGSREAGYEDAAFLQWIGAAEVDLDHQPVGTGSMN
jgi:hypothetical protein